MFDLGWWRWLAIVVPVLVACLISWYGLGARLERALEAELKRREDVEDERFVAECFPDWPHDPAIPVAMRAMVAEQFALPKRRLRPDDDVAFYFWELDIVELVMTVEEQWGVVIADADLQALRVLSIRTLSEYVVAKRQRV